MDIYNDLYRRTTLGTRYMMAVRRRPIVPDAVGTNEAPVDICNST